MSDLGRLFLLWFPHRLPRTWFLETVSCGFANSTRFAWFNSVSGHTHICCCGDPFFLCAGEPEFYDAADSGDPTYLKQLQKHCAAGERIELKVPTFCIRCCCWCGGR